MQGIRLDQHAIKIQCGEKFLESGALAGFAGILGFLSQGNTQCPGINGDLGDKTMSAIIVFNSRTTQCLPITHQLVQTGGPTWDLADHPGLQHLAKLL